MCGAWDVYLKTQEIGNSGKHNVAIDTIAQVLSIDHDIAIEYAISLEILELVNYDPQHQEISLV